MKHWRAIIIATCLIGFRPVTAEVNNVTQLVDASGRWTLEHARAWYAQQPFLAGANFIPSTAGNQLEMWQAETFDPVTIDRELGWAQALGFNSMRVFLHDLLWKYDSTGLIERMERYLAIADQHGIRTLFVLFDSCWNPWPTWGPQGSPRPHTHNSMWVQSPGLAVLQDPTRQAHLKPYVQGVIKHFARDRRIVAWDIWNEPDIFDAGVRATPLEPRNKPDLVQPLLAAAFAWARAAHPTQPLTSPVWNAPGNLDVLNGIEQIQLAHSDVISFHLYSGTDHFQQTVRSLQRLNRPLLCTEYMNRQGGGRFDPLLGFMREQKIAAYCWGLVSGRSQTIYPGHSWRAAFAAAPKIWSTDILYPDGRPYLKTETDYIHKIMKGTNP